MTPPPPRPAPHRRGLAVTALTLAASAAAVGVVAAEPLASPTVGGSPASGNSAPGALASEASALTATSSMGLASATPAWAVPAAQHVPDSTVVPGALVAPGMPGAALAAYRHAQDVLARTYPSCHLSWTLLAGIGTVESANGQYGGSVLDRNGEDRPPVIGIRLDGSVPGTAVVRDTDHGRWDGDPVYDHAVGPMQFLPATWAAYGVSATAGQPPDPENINDAALTAGTYLCDTGNDLASLSGQRSAVLHYNDSQGYADTVIALANAYAAGLVNPVAVTPPGVPVITTPNGETTGAARSATEAATSQTAPAAEATTTRTAPAAAPSTTSTASAGSGTTIASPTPTPTSTATSTATNTTTPIPTTTSSPTTTATTTPTSTATTGRAPNGATPASTPASTDSTTGTPTDSPTSTTAPTTPSTSTSPTPTPTTLPAWVPEGARLGQPTPWHLVLVWPAASTALPPPGATATLEVLGMHGWVAVSALTVPTTATDAMSWQVTQGSFRVAVMWDGAVFVSDAVTVG